MRRPSRGAKRRDRTPSKARDAETGDEAGPPRRLGRKRRAGGKVEGNKSLRPIDKRARVGEIPRLAYGGEPLGISLSMASPWWERSEERGALADGRGGAAGDSVRVTSPAGAAIPLPPGVSPKLGVGALDQALHGYVHGTRPPPPPRGRGVGIPKYPRPGADQNPSPTQEALGLAALAKRNQSAAPTDQTAVTPALLADAGYDPSISSMSGANAGTSGFFARGGGLPSRRAGGGLSEEAKLVWRNLPPGQRQTLWARMSPVARRAVQDAERPGHLHAGVAPSHRRGGRLR